MELDELEQVGRAYELLIAALDHARLTAREIRAIAEAVSGLSEGGSFSVKIQGLGSDAYEATVVITYWP